MGPCAEGLDWPVLDRVHIMGLLGKINDASVKLELLSPDGLPPRASASGSIQVNPVLFKFYGTLQPV